MDPTDSVWQMLEKHVWQLWSTVSSWTQAAVNLQDPRMPVVYIDGHSLSVSACGFEAGVEF